MESQETLQKIESLKEGEIFQVRRGERAFVGSNPASVRRIRANERAVQINGLEGSLSRCALELTLTDQDNVRVERGVKEVDYVYSPQNSVTVWGQDEKRGAIWNKWSLIVNLPDMVYQRIDGGSVIIDIETNKGILRLNDAGRAEGSRFFRVELNPKKLNLSK